MTFREQRPTTDEYAEYFDRYISKVPDEDIIEILKEQFASSLELYSNVPDALENYRYAPEKWSLKQVVGHIIDAEWVFTYRALRFARGDQTPLPGMDQDVFMAGANFEARSFESVTAEYKYLRSANLTLFESFDEAILDRTGNASGVDFSVRALLWLTAGHERHHIKVLRERYLNT